MELVVNNNPLWTIKHLVEVRKNLIALNESFSDDVFIEEKNNIENGKPTLRHAIEESTCYDLYENGQLVGEIVISLEADLYNVNVIELTILIFEEYYRRGYAKKAISQFIEQYEGRYDITAVVQYGNPKKDFIEKALISNGFIYEQNICIPSDVENRYYRYIKK